MDKEKIRNKKYLKDWEAAILLDVSRGTIRRWSKKNEQFPKPVKLSERCTRWLTEEIQNWEKNLSSQA